MPAYISGCLNLRGTVIPVVDLRPKFSANPSDEDTIDCIVDTEVQLGGDKLLMGLVVDSVDEVTSLKRSNLEPAPEVGGGPDTKFISSTGKVKDRLVVLLDIDRVIAANTLLAMKNSVEGLDPDIAVSYQ